MSTQHTSQSHDPGTDVLAVDFAARITAAVVANGATVAEAVRYGREILSRAGVEHSDLDTGYGAVGINWLDPDGRPRLRMERVDSYGFDYGVLTRASNIAADYIQGGTTLAEPRGHLAEIVTTATSCSKKVTVTATAAAAAMRLLDPDVDPTSVVISIIIMMAGMASTSAVQDTITGHYMHGLGRIYEGLVNTAGLVVGVRPDAGLFTTPGVPLPVTNDVSLASIPLWLMLIAAFVAVGNGIILQSPARVVFPTATLAMLVYAVYAALSTGEGADAWARGAAAFTAGIGTAILPRWVKAPSSAMSITSSLVLLPETLLYQGIWGGPPCPAGRLCTTCPRRSPRP
ncbi:threonine/serine exporter family protein [Kocuria marina]